MAEGKAPDPWAGFPGGNPFGPGGPFGPGSPFAGPPGDPFQNLDAWLRHMGVDPADFRRLAEEMQRNLQEAFRNMGQDPSRSFVSGFSVRVGPDGKPNFTTFGNKPLRPQPGGKIPQVVSDEREPLTDIIEEERRIAITMELPGVDKKDIQIHVTPEELEIAVDTERRKYHKRLVLPRKVVPETTKATYNNGVLDVTIEKQDNGKAPGLKVNVD